MSRHNKQPRADVRRLQAKLDDAQRQLFELENSRVLRSYHHLRHSAVNPFWGIRNITKVPSLLKKVGFPETLTGRVTYRPALPGDEEGSFMSYPNFKVASIGLVPDMSIYCHHLPTESSEWHRLIDKGIDALVVGDLKGYSTKKTTEIVKIFTDAKVPVFVLYPHTKLPDIKFTRLKSYITVDFSLYNPINLPDDQSAKPHGIYSKAISPLGVDEFSELSKESLYQYSSVVLNQTEFNSTYQHALAVLSSLSCGILALTKKTELLADLLPKDFPYQTNDKAKSSTVFKDDLDWKCLSVKLRRYVHLNFSPRVLVDEVAVASGFTKESYAPTISIILCTRRPDLVMAALKQVEGITYEKKELLLVLHGDGFNRSEINAQINKLKIPVSVIEKSTESLFGDNLNAALDLATGEYITKMDDDDYYGPNIYQDLLAAYEYSRATVVGKRTNLTYLENSDTVVTFAGGHEEKFGPHLPGHSFLMRTDILKKLRFGRVKKAIDSELWRRLESRGGTLYSTHSLNFVRVRHGNAHTYEVEDEDFIANSTTKPVKGLNTKDYFI